MTDVSLEQLSKTYEGSRVPAVSDLSLEIPRGSLVALLGPSGCGKTTTLKMIAGLLPPSSGHILFDGKPVTSVRAERREAVMVFQNHLLFPFMSVGENVGFGLKMRHESRAAIRKRVREMLSLVHLEGFEDRRPNQLSGGQQQRVALARALIVRPKVLLLDEPLSNLDAHLRDEMRELILSIQRQLDLTTIFVTHDQQEAVLLADRIALLFQGRLQQYSATRLFYEQPRTREIATFFGSRNFLQGEKSGDRVRTIVGEFRVARSQAPDGDVTLMIRPEAVQITPGAENSVSVLVTRQIYMGTHTRYRVQIDSREWEVVGQAESRENLEGKRIRITLPPEHLWIIPEADVLVPERRAG
jgi:ABC-type Fe3+/spermidine/putrescine transport system ATPase subunit